MIRNKVLSFIKTEPILVSILLLAGISMFIIPPNSSYRHYINYEVLIVLFSLMALIGGLTNMGVMNVIIDKMLTETHNSKIIAIMLVNISFVLSMFVTNDVAIMTIVPLTIIIFKPLKNAKKLIFVLIMITIAANLGGIFLPTGSPHNLYLYSFYDMHIMDFLRTVVPIGIISYLMISFLMSRMPSETLDYEHPAKINKIKIIPLLVYCVLFVMILLTVLKYFDPVALFLISTAVFLIFDRAAFRKVDYPLLLTFVVFFIFVGNLQEMSVVKKAISEFIHEKEFLTAVIVSQFCSNVPASMMLSAFTNNGTALLLGANVGGLGTPIASMASVITYGIYSKSECADTKEFLKQFLIYNFAFLIILVIVVFLLNWVFYHTLNFNII